MTTNLSLFVDLLDTSLCSVGFADGSKMLSSSMGVLPLTDTIFLYNVFKVLHLSNCSLIFVSTFLKQLKSFGAV